MHRPLRIIVYLCPSARNSRKKDTVCTGNGLLMYGRVADGAVVHENGFWCTKQGAGREESRPGSSSPQRPAAGGGIFRRRCPAPKNCQTSVLKSHYRPPRSTCFSLSAYPRVLIISPCRFRSRAPLSIPVPSVGPAELKGRPRVNVIPRNRPCTRLGAHLMGTQICMH